MKRILVAVDGSKTAVHAAEVAADLATRLGAELLLVHALEPIPAAGGLGGAPYVELQRGLEDWGQKTLAMLAQKLESASLKPRTQLVRGRPAEAIAALAKEEGSDLVVVGTRGANALSRALLGSVADRLVHVCERPVLVVR